MPSVVLGEIFPPDRRAPGRIFTALADLAATGWYRRAEIPPPDSAGERATAARAVRDSSLKLTCWASELLAAQGLNLSSLDAATRRHSVDRCAEIMHRAADCGADALGLLSGPDPGPARRPRAQQALTDSLAHLGRVAAQIGGFTVVLEPLDRDAHKQGLIGPSADAVALMEKLHRETDRVLLGWDSGHMALNREDPVTSLQQAAPYVYQLHLSNPVTDRNDPRFGDHHFPVGEFGAGTPAEFARIISAARTLHFPRARELSVAIEVRTPADRSPAETLGEAGTLLRQLLGEDAVEKRNP